jgi:predicted lipoprotein with Yx(FWY)xxD motif
MTAPGATSGTVILRPEHTKLGTVLATGQGFTLYRFTRDSDMASACTGACAQTWHPLIGTPRAATGVSLPGKLGTITRSGGVRQATFNGHPLYTLKDDTAPGEVKGNGESEFGGSWFAIPISSAMPVTPSTTSSATPSATTTATPSVTSSAAPTAAHSSGSGP